MNWDGQTAIPKGDKVSFTCGLESRPEFDLQGGKDVLVNGTCLGGEQWEPDNENKEWPMCLSGTISILGYLCCLLTWINICVF